MKHRIGLLCAALVVLPVLAKAEPIAFEQAANVTGLAGIEVGAEYDYAYEKITDQGVTLSENTWTDVPVFVRVGIPVLEAKLTVPYGSLRSNVAAAQEQDYTGLQNIGLMLKTGLLTLPVFSFAVGLDTSFPTGDPKKYLGEGLDLDPFVAMGVDLLFFKLHANVGYRYRGEYNMDVASIGVKVKPGNDLNYAVGLEIPAGEMFSLHAELVGDQYAQVTQDSVALDNSAGKTMYFVPGVRLHAGPLKAKLAYEIPLEQKSDRPLDAPRADWRVIVGASLQFSL